MPAPEGATQAGLLRALYAAAVAAASAEQRLPPFLPSAPRGRTVVVGAGKAAAAMAQSVERHWQGELSGLVITRYGHGLPCQRIEVVEAGHPAPDAAGEQAAARILQLAGELGPDDLLLCLISGGGSALLTLPPPGITLAEKRAITRALLRSGAAIAEMNCVRKHLSAIKGGRLALAAQRAPVVSLIISDVPGDDLSVIASGPTVADPSTRQQALAVLERHAIATPDSVRAWLQDPASETPKPGDTRLGRVRNELIATPQQSLLAAAEVARAAGYTPLILGDALEGEARESARVHAGIALACQAHGTPLPAPCALLSGGETTVMVRGAGRGGRNAEFLLGLALALQGRAGIHALAADTDGIDGTEDNAGALLAPDCLQRAAALGLDVQALQADNDAYAFFAALDALLVTGPTRTNVNDFRAILVDN
ncbi:MAG: glycerate kinase [Steroidobacteraceae bacterium]